MNQISKRILIIPGTTDLNRGDQALLWKSIDIVNDLYKNSEIFLYESGNTNSEKYIQKKQTEKKGYFFLERLIKHPRGKAKSNAINYSILILITWVFRAVIDFLKTSLLLFNSTTLNKIGYFFLSKEQKKTYNIFCNLDIVVVKGGGFLHSYGKYTDIYLMYFFLYDILLAIRLKINVVVLPNSIGPFQNKIALRLVKETLRKCSFISTRESVSSKYLRESFLINNSLFPDLGFYLKSSEFDLKDELKNFGVDFYKQKVAITLRPYRFDDKPNATALYERYISEITKVINNLISKNIQISLIVHTLGPSAHENDRLAIDDVSKRIGENLNVVLIDNKEWDCQQLQKVYSYYDVLIGTRFHSVIFALNMFVPCIAIAYGGNKSYGIMEDIGLSDYVIGIDKVSEVEIMKMFDSIMNNKKSYIDKIKKYRLVLEEKRKVLINQISNNL